MSSLYGKVQRERETILKEGAEWRSLASAVVLRAVYDWEILCRRCATGRVFCFTDKNFDELERFFQEYADPLLIEVNITGAQILERLLPMKEAAMMKRRGLEKRGKVSGFGSLLKYHRERKGVSRRELSERMGVSEHIITRWESGEVNAMRSMQEKALKALNMSWADFFL